MTAAWAVLGGLLGLIIVLLRDVIKDLGRGEVQARLTQLPQALLWLAVRQVPGEWRDDLWGEWRSELDAIRREQSETPLTGLAHGIFFAVGLLVRARAIARAYAGRPQALAPVWDAIRRLAIRGIPFVLRNRAARPGPGGFALAAPDGSGSGTISIRRPVAIAVGLALVTGAALTLYAVRPGPAASPSYAVRPGPAGIRSVLVATLGSYLAQSSAVRPGINDAISGVQGCSESPQSGQAALQQAIGTRQDILHGLRRLSVSGLPNGAQLVSALTTAMQASITDDKDFKNWMADEASSGSSCPYNISQDSSYAAGTGPDNTAATQAKDAFLTYWNPMTSRYGQQPYSDSGF